MTLHELLELEHRGWQSLCQSTGDSAVLAYRGTAWRGGDEPAFSALMSSVYVRTDAGWRLASYQQTPLPAGA